MATQLAEARTRQFLQPQQSVAPEWRRDIEAMTSEFTRSLPPQIPTERFVRTILTAVQINPELARADRHSLKVACMKAAQDALLPDGREGALVIYKTKVRTSDGQERWVDAVQWMPMVWGLMKKARNSGEIASITAHVVYRHDHFKLRFGDEECLEHEPGDAEDKELVEANAIGAYAIAKLKDGTIVRAWRPRSLIMLAKSQSKAAAGPMWTKFWEEAWIKTAIRYLTKYLPASTDKEGVDTLARAAARDDELVDFNRAHDITPQHSKLESSVAATDEAKDTAAEEMYRGPDENADDVQEESNVPKRRGRPPGSSNRPKAPTAMEQEQSDETVDQQTGEVTKSFKVEGGETESFVGKSQLPFEE